MVLSFIFISFNNSCNEGTTFVQLFKFHKLCDTLNKVIV